jgi:photosystem II stability/assembly factor-like uncharacterized protein
MTKPASGSGGPRSRSVSHLLGVPVACAIGLALTTATAVLGFACSEDKPTPTKDADGAVVSGPVEWRAVVGLGGLVGQTFDEHSWSVRTPLDADLFAVTCVGNLHGWAAGARGTVAHTDDGGATWVLQKTPFRVPLRAIRFHDLANGIVAGDDGALAVTKDGGATWQAIAPEVAGRGLNGLAGTTFAGTTMIAVGQHGLVLRSVDGGVTWSGRNLDAGDFTAVASDAEGHEVFATDATGAIWASSDQGASFAAVYRTADGASLRGVAMADEGGRAMAVGAHGTVLWRDAVGSKAWTAIASGTVNDLNAALVTDTGSAFAAGVDGTLLESVDRHAWTRIPLGTHATLYGLEDL